MVRGIIPGSLKHHGDLRHSDFRLFLTSQRGTSLPRDLILASDKFTWTVTTPTHESAMLLRYLRCSRFITPAVDKGKLADTVKGSGPDMRLSAVGDSLGLDVRRLSFLRGKILAAVHTEGSAVNRALGFESPLVFCASSTKFATMTSLNSLLLL